MVVILWILWLCKQGELAVLSPALLLRAQPVQRRGVESTGKTPCPSLLSVSGIPCAVSREHATGLICEHPLHWDTLSWKS